MPSAAPARWFARLRGALPANGLSLYYFAILFALAYLVNEFVEDVRHTQAEHHHQLQHEARTAAARFESSFLSWETSLSGVAEMNCVQKKESIPCQERFARLLTRFPDAVSLGAYDLNGQLIASSGLPIRLPEALVSDNPQPPPLSQTRKLFDPRPYPATGEPIGAMTAPLFDRAGQYDGGLWVEFSMKYLRNALLVNSDLNPIQHPVSNAILVLNHEGKIIDAPEEHRSWVGQALKTLVDTPGAVSATHHAMTVPGFSFKAQDKRYHAVIVPIYKDGWQVLAIHAEQGMLDLLAVSLRAASLHSIPIALLILIIAANMMRARRAELALRASESDLRLALAQTEQQVQARTKSLSESQARYRALFDLAPSAVALVGADGTILDANRNALILTGYSREELLECKFADLFPTDHLSETADAVDHSDVPDISLSGREVLAKQKNGREFQVLLNTTLLPGEADETDETDETAKAGAAPLFLAAWSDLSDWVRTQEQMRFSQKMQAVGVLAGGIAHDFNNLLAIVMGHTQLIQDAAPANSPIRSFAEKIAKSATRARSIIKQLLDFSRQSDEAPRLMSLATELSDIQTLLVASNPRHITLNFRLEEAISPIWAVPHQIQQVIINLINNASDAIGESPGTVDISLTEEHRSADTPTLVGKLLDGRYAVLRIKDSGGGIDERALSQIFLPFFTTKEVGRGTGLGLAVVRGIMEECGGAIRVLTHPGSGSTFELFFPVAEGTLFTLEAQLPAAQGFQEIVLVVDDEPDVVEAYMTFLKNCGFRPVYEASGPAALAYLAQQQTARPEDRVRAIMTDLVMPGMDGLHLTKALHARWPDLPVLLMTGRSDRLSQEMKSAAGLAGVISKPVEPQVIANELRRVIDAVKVASA